jgi:hypothetical protein
MLDAYDREIIALQNTQRVAGLSDPAARVRQAAVALSRDENTARIAVANLVGDTRQDRDRERAAIAAAMASERAGDRGMRAYRNALTRETNANLSGYANAMAQRTERAVSAREQQLREKELTLAFDLARRHAGQRLMLRLKLHDLHLDNAKRARLQAELDALNKAQGAQVAAMRRTDAAILDAYRREVMRQSDVSNAQMAAQLRSKADANLGLRLQVLRAEASAAPMPSLTQRLASFGSSYHFPDDAAVITDKLRTAGADLRQTFERVAQADRLSSSQTAAQIARLKANRAALYRSMATQIVREAQRLARERHLTGVVTSGSRPAGSVDLTGALRAQLVRFWSV